MLFRECVCICVCVCVWYIYIYIMTLWECAIHPDLEIRDFYGAPLFSKGNHHFFRKATLTALLHCPYSLTLFSSWYYFIFFTHIIFLFFPSSLFFPLFLAQCLFSFTCPSEPNYKRNFSIFFSPSPDPVLLFDCMEHKNNFWKGEKVNCFNKILWKFKNYSPYFSGKEK